MKSPSQAHENRRCFPAGMLQQLLLHRRLLQRAAQIGAELFLMLEGPRSLGKGCEGAKRRRRGRGVGSSHPEQEGLSLETCTSEVRTRTGSATLCCVGLVDDVARRG